MERQSAHPTRQLDLVDTTNKHSQTVLALILVTFASMQHDGQADSAVAHETNVLIREGENHQEHSRIHRKNIPCRQATIRSRSPSEPAPLKKKNASDARQRFV